MPLRPLRCSIVILAGALSACATNRDLTQNNLPPANYKSDVLSFLRTYLNDPTNIRDATMSPPVLAAVGSGQRYVACVRFNAKNTDGKYAGAIDTAAIFNNGKLDRFLPLIPDETAPDARVRTQLRDTCKGAAYQPFPELEHLTR